MTDKARDEDPREEGMGLVAWMFGAIALALILAAVLLAGCAPLVATYRIYNVHQYGAESNFASATVDKQEQITPVKASANVIGQ